MWYAPPRAPVIPNTHYPHVWCTPGIATLAETQDPPSQRGPDLREGCGCRPTGRVAN